MYKQLPVPEHIIIKNHNLYMELLQKAIGPSAYQNFKIRYEDRLITTPASSHVQYHSCYPGGLIQHSLRVYRNLKKLADSFLPSGLDETLILVSLLHDIGKLGSMLEPYYIESTNQWRIDNLGECYTTNSNLTYLGTAQRSIFIINGLGIMLTEEEYQAILIHDGQYVEENKRYAHKETMLGLLLHQADMIACKQEFEQWRKFNDGIR